MFKSEILKSYFFFKDFIYLFDRDRDSQRERGHKQGKWERKKQVPRKAWSPMWGSIPEPRNHALSQRQTLNDWATQVPLRGLYWFRLGELFHLFLVYFHVFFFFLKILFIYVTERQRESEHSRGEGEEEAGSQPRSPMWDSIPGSRPEPKADAQRLHYPGTSK